MWHKASFTAALVGSLLSTFVPGAGFAQASLEHARSQPITALAPVEIWAARLGSPFGIALDSAGHVYVSDREAGTVTRIAPDRRRVLVAAGLQRPGGLTFDLDGRLLIAEERAGRVVRVEANGRRTIVMSDVKQPRWLAVSDTGRLFVSARRLGHDTDREPDDESDEPEMILTVGGDGRPALFADGFKQLQGLATCEGVVYAATRGRREDPRAAGVVFQIPILANGSAGPPARLGPSGTFKRPIGLARDGLGALYLTTEELGVIGKLHHDDTATRFASHLDDPKGLAFDTDGNLYVADGRSGRVVRFLTPPAPSLEALPAYTNQTTLSVRGTTEASARVDVFVNDGAASLVGVADAAGAFAVPVTLAPDTENVLEMFATGHAGDGLASAPAEARIIHDGIPPALAFQAPPAGAFVRQAVQVAAQASDGGSGVATLGLSVDGQSLSSTVAPVPPTVSATATASWPTYAVADGSHTLEVAATDRAGNAAFRTRVVIVDNTPPTVQITDGPAGTVQETSALFTFTGADNLTPVGSLQFEWRLDGDAWSAFAPDTTAALAGLAPGAHLFEVKARDLAGNESLAPAQQAFTLSTLRVTITEPANGASVPSGSLLVRGTVDAGGQEVGVAVNGIPAALQGGSFAAAVPVTPGTVVLTATGTTTSGGTADHSVTVTAIGVGPEAWLLAGPLSGLPPLTVSFSLTVGSGSTIALDADGDGTIDFTGPVLDGQTFTYTQPGLYFPTATITDGQGNQITARAVVQVYDRVAIDATFKAQWGAMKSSLVRNDIPGAAAHFAQAQQDRYRALFTALSADIAQIARDMQNIELIYVTEGRAKYRLPRTQLWGGQPMTLTYYVYFVQDGSGLWMIESF